MHTFSAKSEIILTVINYVVIKFHFIDETDDIIKKNGECQENKMKQNEKWNESEKKYATQMNQIKNVKENT